MMDTKQTQDNNTTIVNEYENITPWNGAYDTGRDVRLKWERNFARVAANFVFLLNNIGTIEAELKNFLRKDRSDQTLFLLKLLGGIISPFLESPDFVTGMMGSGMSFSSEGGSSVGWIDKLYVRKKAVFQLLEIMKTELAGASFLFNASGARATLTNVEKLDQEAYFIDGDKGYFPNGDEAYFPDVYRCYFMVDDGDTAVENLFKVGDLVRSQTFNIESGIHEGVSNHYWWRLVVGTGKDYIDLSSINMDDGSDEPAVGDVIVQLGNIDDVDRQAAIVMSAYGDGAPSITMYQGIDNYSLSGKDIFSIGYDKIKKRCYLKVMGEAYIGERDRKNYFEFIPGEGLRVKAREFLYESGKTVVQASQEAISLKLGEAGIDIDSKTVTVTASSFFVNNSENKPISVFTTDSEGNPLLKAEYIDVNNLKVKHLDGADGTFTGSISIADKTVLREDGSGSLANGNITWDADGNLSMIYSFSISKDGYTLKLDQEFAEYRIYDSEERTLVSLSPYTDIPGYSSPSLHLNHPSSGMTAKLDVMQLYLGDANNTFASFGLGGIQFRESGNVFNGYTGMVTIPLEGVYNRNLYFKNGILYKVALEPK
ncbi:hypothetical protein [Phocaeicola sp.]|uniref:hypothetical protein n=1 Tax=Phocaeicola sp. TaxID=2773926 RepID=UPI003AB3BBB6